MIAYVLDKQIDGGEILIDIDEMVKKFKKDSPGQTPILIINIKSISREDTSLIPKLEYKNLEPDCTT